MSFISGSGVPPVDPSATSSSGASSVGAAQWPASVRNGDAKAQQAYETGLAFERLLVGELTQQLASTGSGSDGSDGSDDSSGSGSSNGLMGSDPASSMYSELLPSALTAGLMSAGGTGMALALARALDPAIGTTAAAGSQSTTAPAATGGTGISSASTGGTAVTGTSTGGAAGDATSGSTTSSGGAGLGAAQSISSAQTSGTTSGSSSVSGTGSDSGSGSENEGAEGAESAGEGEDG